MTSKTDKELEQFARDLLDIVSRIMHNSRTRMMLNDDIEVSMPQAFLLYELSESGTISMSELSHRFQTTQGVATRMVDRLVDKGLLERKRNPQDRRVVLVNLSAKGEELSRAMEKDFMQKTKAIFRTVSASERGDFLEFLKRVARQIEES